MKIVSVVGARPNFCNKEMILNQEFRKANVEEILIHTGQHYDANLSKIFFDQLGIPEPNYHFNISRGDGTKQISEILLKMQEVLQKEQPDVTLVHGDVVSTLAAAIASVKLKIPVAHVEAGIRAENLYNPEEINRRVADVLSDTLFAPVKSAYDNLLKENFPKEKVFLTGDVVNDSLLHVTQKFGINIEKGDYILTTLHREENVTNKDRLTNIIQAMIESGKRFIFPPHPRTMSKLQEYGLMSAIEQSNIEIIEPQGYIEFLKLLAGANKVLTDSGGVRREGYILGKPVIVPMNLPWFPEIFESGWGVLTKANKEEILKELNNFDPAKENIARPNVFGDGKASEKIVQILKDRYEK